mmetsp:Transcript_26744/g.54751  ORF Transcript_26744/g.54751 Transcript_26744/m.54751 type:complete len:208 (-) Transcript_26744:152-775(-)
MSLGAAGRNGGARKSLFHQAEADKAAKKRSESQDRFERDMVRSHAFMSQFDTDKSGRLDKSQLKLLMEHLHNGIEVPQEDLDRVFTKADKSKTGDLKLKEIVEASSIWSAMVKEQAFVAEKFDKYDTDRSDALDFEQLKACLADLNGSVPPTDDEVHRIIEKVDKSKTGSVHRNELFPAVENWYVQVSEHKQAEKIAKARSSLCLIM